MDGLVGDFRGPRLLVGYKCGKNTVPPSIVMMRRESRPSSIQENGQLGIDPTKRYDSGKRDG
jgi:hypothetical protein